MIRSNRLPGSLVPLELAADDEPDDYCEDGSCGVCPGCRFQEGDEKYHRRVDEKLEGGGEA